MGIKKYRIDSARWQDWDYGWDGAYFITICTKNRKHYFGPITNGQSKLSSIGIIADVFWHEIKNHADNIQLGEFVVMPNHIHGILILAGNRTKGDGELDDKAHPVSPGQKRFRNPGKNTISSIVGGYKSAVTKHARRVGFDFSWQPRFWDHVIRNEQEYHRISQYIINNPQKWTDDKFNGGAGNVVLEPVEPYGVADWMIF